MYNKDGALWVIAHAGTSPPCSIELAEVLDIRAAARLKDALSQILNKPTEVSIKADRVERLSTPCIQVLLAFAIHRWSSNLPTRLVEPSAAFVDSFDILGLSNHLNSWRSAP